MTSMLVQRESKRFENEGLITLGVDKYSEHFQRRTDEQANQECFSRLMANFLEAFD